MSKPRIISLVVTQYQNPLNAGESDNLWCWARQGVPIIVELLDQLNKANYSQHIISITGRNPELLQTVSEFEQGVVFVFEQPSYFGKAPFSNAVRALERFGQDGVLLAVTREVMVQADYLEALTRNFLNSDHDFALVKAPLAHYPGANRLLSDLNGKTIGSVPIKEMGLSRLLATLFSGTEGTKTLSVERIRTLMARFLGDDYHKHPKLKPFLADVDPSEQINRKRLHQFFKSSERLIQLRADRTVTGAEAEKSQFAELGIYLLRLQVLFEFCENMHRPPNEVGFPDMVAYVSAHPEMSLGIFEIDDPHAFQPFDKPEQRQAFVVSPDVIERAKRNGKSIPEPSEETVSEAIRSKVRGSESAIDTDPIPAQGQQLPLDEWLQAQYVPESKIFQEKLADVQTLLHDFRSLYGSGVISLVRVPWAIPLAGGALDGLGGMGVAMAGDREVFLALRAAKQPVLRLALMENGTQKTVQLRLEPYYQALEKAGGWYHFIREPRVLQSLQDPRLGPLKPLLLSVLWLRSIYPGKVPDGYLVGQRTSIPERCVQPISAATQVALTEAVCQLMRLPAAAPLFVRMAHELAAFRDCAPASYQLAVMLRAEPGHLAVSQFNPLAIAQPVAWPAGWRVLLCNTGSDELPDSLEPVRQDARAAMRLLQEKHTELSEPLGAIRTIRPKTLRMKLSEFYRFLKFAPEEVHVDQLTNGRGKKGENLRAYPRDALIACVAEYARVRQFILALRKNNLTPIRRLVHLPTFVTSRWRASENDRAVHYDDDHLEKLALLAEKGSSRSVLYALPVRLGQLSKEGRRFADFASSLDEVIAVNSAGPHCQNSFFVIAENNMVDELFSVFEQDFYNLNDIDMDVADLTPASGKQGLLLHADAESGVPHTATADVAAR